MALVAFSKRDDEIAETYLQAARSICRRIGEMEGIASVDWLLGELRFAENASELACDLWSKSIQIKRMIPRDLSLPGWEALYKAKCASDIEEIAVWLEQARAIWNRIGRRDLVAEFIDLPLRRNNNQSSNDNAACPNIVS